MKLQDHVHETFPSLTAALLEYLRRVFELQRREDTREESFYSSLEALLVCCAAHLGRKDVRVTVIPKRREGSLLDFQVWRGGRPVGYVEAKRPGTDLEIAEDSAQLKRYRQTFPNLVLTDFHQFRLYRRGDLASRAHLLCPHTVRLLTRDYLEGVDRVEGEAALLELLDAFFAFEAPGSVNAAGLAVAMAGRTRVLAGRIEELLERDVEGTSDLSGLYRAFTEYLIADLPRRDFADLYAQTVAYGMLAARCREPGDAFDRTGLFERIPRTIGILRDVFRYISLGDTPPEIRWILDDLAHLLAPAPVRRILERSQARRGKDPILHFYETFLASYDRDLRRRRGVFYTPQPVVSWVVRSVHWLLATRLGLTGGLAHPGVSLLDPAAGTLTFLVEALRLAVGEYRAAWGDGSGPALVRDRLLQSFHAFELMMAPYAIGHLHVSLELEAMGCPLEEDERFQLYLTDALDLGELEQTSLLGTASLSREFHLAERIKKGVPDGCEALVVLGNPPWFGHSCCRSPEIDILLKKGYDAPDGRRDEGYYRAGGRPLGEANPRWLQDDYVKFLRFGQWKIDQAGQGVLAFVTNHGYLDNPTFRGMRRSLLETFDELYVLDLHGNGKKGERAPDGRRDENVFEGVRQGVAIALFVKRPGLPKRIFRADLQGRHGDKLCWLAEHDIASTQWRELQPEGPAWLFTPRDVDLEREYARGVRLPDIFPVHSAGVVTARDEFAIDRDARALLNRIVMLRTSPLPDELLGEGLRLRDTGTWRLAEARRRAGEDDGWRGRFQKILYRPFDFRHVFYADYLLERPREALMHHMLAGSNLGLVVPRQSKDAPGSQPAALVTDRLVAHKAVSAYDINYLFPLWLHTRGEGLFTLEEDRRVPNLGPAFLRPLQRMLGEEPAPEEILGWVYAVLYSPAWRERYASLLRQDFPRIPFPRDRRAFREIAVLGTELIRLHLLQSDRLARPLTGLSGGSGMVGSARGLPRYAAAERRVVLNEEGQYFDGVEPEVWACRIGGHQVLCRWLQARAGYRLTDEEIRTFCRTVAALRETLWIERRIDSLLAETGVEAGAGGAR